MGFDFLGAGALANAAKGIVSALDNLFTSDDERNQAVIKIMAILQQSDALQGQITLAEAQSESKFKSWWRPALAWVCVSGLGLHFLIFPLTEATLAIWDITFIRPAIDALALMNLVMALLGLGVYRSFEKFKGLTK